MIDRCKPISVHSSLTKYGTNYENNQQEVLYRLIYYSKSAIHVSGDVFARNMYSRLRIIN